MSKAASQVNTKETGADARLEREHKRLLRLWATGRATRKQIERCMELDRRAVALAQHDLLGLVHLLERESSANTEQAK